MITSQPEVALPSLRKFISPVEALDLNIDESGRTLNWGVVMQRDGGGREKTTEE
jgi:hypothetical protein